MLKYVPSVVKNGKHCDFTVITRSFTVIRRNFTVIRRKFTVNGFYKFPKLKLSTPVNERQANHSVRPYLQTWCEFMLQTSQQNSFDLPRPHGCLTPNPCKSEALQTSSMPENKIGLVMHERLLLTLSHPSIVYIKDEGASGFLSGYMYCSVVEIL